MGNITLASKPRQVEAWLETLPLGDPLVAATMLDAYLRAHDSAEVAPGFRKELFEIVGTAFRRIVNTLEAEFRDMPLPMDGHQLAHVDRALELLDAAAGFNRRLVQEYAARPRPFFGENPLPVQLGRLLRLKREIMGLCHLSHRELPEGFWLEVHQAGALLFRAGLAEAPDPGHPDTKLAELYLGLLLEATADPYHMSAQERIWVLDIIARHGCLAAVGPVQGLSRGGVFGIRAHEDKPPYPLAWQNEMAPNCDLVLSTAPLVRKLALILGQLDQNRLSPQALPASRHPGYKALLQRLKQTWGGASQRTMARHKPVRPGQRRVIVGFYPIYHHLSGRGDLYDDGAVIQCQVANESLGGVALQMMNPPARLKIGSLVCVNRGQGDAWSDLGIVRWFKTGAHGVLTFGVKYLHGRMRPIVWKTPGDMEALPGLLAEPEKGRLKRPRTLVVQGDGPDPEGSIEGRQGERRFAIHLTGKVCAHPEVSVFRCDPEDVA